MQTSNLLYSMFGRSPIGPIQKHIATAHRCAKKLEPFFVASFSGDWEKALIIQEKIVSLEQKANNIKQSIRLSLPQSIFLPVSRSDLLEIITIQDKVANRAKDIAGIVIGRKMQAPDTLHTIFLTYLCRAIATSAQALKVMSTLDELLETGFQGREVDFVGQLIEELDHIERETEDLQAQVKHALFSIEQELPPVDVIFLYKTIERVGDLAEEAFRVGSRLQLLLAR